MMLTPGTPGENGYGPDPRDRLGSRARRVADFLLAGDGGPPRLHRGGFVSKPNRRYKRADGRSRCTLSRPHLLFGRTARRRRGAARRVPSSRGAGDEPSILFVGRMMDEGVGPHPIPQYEVHFLERVAPRRRRRDRSFGIAGARPSAHRRRHGRSHHSGALDRRAGRRST